MTVATILKTKGSHVEIIDPDRTLGEAAKILDERRIGAVVVVDGAGKVQGILSERDIVKAAARSGAAALQERVAEHMTTAVETTETQEPMVSIMERMTHGRFRHMPVLEEGRLIGIVSIGDVVKHRLAEIEAEASAMREYIATA